MTKADKDYESPEKNANSSVDAIKDAEDAEADADFNQADADAVFGLG